METFTLKSEKGDNYKESKSKKITEMSEIENRWLIKKLRAKKWFSENINKIAETFTRPMKEKTIKNMRAQITNTENDASWVIDIYQPASEIAPTIPTSWWAYFSRDFMLIELASMTKSYHETHQVWLPRPGLKDIVLSTLFGIESPTLGAASCHVMTTDKKPSGKVHMTRTSCQQPILICPSHVWAALMANSAFLVNPPNGYGLPQPLMACSFMRAPGPGPPNYHTLEFLTQNLGTYVKSLNICFKLLSVCLCSSR